MHSEKHLKLRDFLARLKRIWQSRSVYSAFNSFAQKRSGNEECLALPNPLPPSWGETFSITKLNSDNLHSVGKGSYLAEGSRISGRLSFEGSLRIDGEVEGKVEGQGTLEIGESGVVTVAKLEATSVIVAGKVRCGITSQQLEICATGEVRGDVAANSIVIRQGGQLNGNVVSVRNTVGRSPSSERDVSGKVVAIMSRAGS